MIENALSQTPELISTILALAPIISTMIVSINNGKLFKLKTSRTGKGFTEAKMTQHGKVITVPGGARAQVSFSEDGYPGTQIMIVDDYIKTLTAGVSPEVFGIVELLNTAEKIRVSPDCPQAFSTNNNIKVVFQKD